MHLQDKLASIKDENITSELSELLKSAKIRNSYTGQRLLEVTGYEGEVTINHFAQIFFKAPAFRAENSTSLTDRLACDDLWNDIQKLYTESNKQLGKSSYLYQAFTLFKEFRPYCRACSGDPQAIIGEWDFGGTRSSLFEFRPEEFKTLFDGKDYVGRSWSIKGEYWLATRKMVEEACNKPTNSLKPR
jgi:hypothetical protein